MEVSCISAPSATAVWAAAYDTTASASYNGEYTRTTNGGTTWTPSTVTNASGFLFHASPRLMPKQCLGDHE